MRPIYTVNEAAFSKELLALLPAETLQTNKGLSAILETTDGLLLRFSDGSSEHTDGLVVADGAYDFFRKHLLGTSAVMEPKVRSCQVVKNVVSYETAVQKLGIDILDEDHAWIGNGVFLAYTVSDDGDKVECLAVWSDDVAPPEEGEDRPGREIMEVVFDAWQEKHIAMPMIEVSRVRINSTLAS